MLPHFSGWSPGGKWAEGWQTCLYVNSPESNTVFFKNVCIRAVEEGGAPAGRGRLPRWCAHLPELSPAPASLQHFYSVPYSGARPCSQLYYCIGSGRFLSTLLVSWGEGTVPSWWTPEDPDPLVFVESPCTPCIPALGPEWNS